MISIRSPATTGVLPNAVTGTITPFRSTAFPAASTPNAANNSANVPAPSNGRKPPFTQTLFSVSFMGDRLNHLSASRQAHSWRASSDHLIYSKLFVIAVDI